MSKHTITKSGLKLTENEVNVLRAFSDFFNYADAASNKADNACVGTVEEIASITGMAVKSVKGVLGSLYRKDLACETEYGELHEQKGFTLTDDGFDTYAELFEASDETAVPEASRIEEPVEPKAQILIGETHTTLLLGDDEISRKNKSHHGRMVITRQLNDFTIDEVQFIVNDEVADITGIETGQARTTQSKAYRVIEALLS